MALGDVIEFGGTPGSGHDDGDGGDDSDVRILGWWVVERSFGRLYLYLVTKWPLAQTF